jgi:hypothetical protein
MDGPLWRRLRREEDAALPVVTEYGALLRYAGRARRGTIISVGLRDLVEPGTMAN